MLDYEDDTQTIVEYDELEEAATLSTDLAELVEELFGEDAEESQWARQLQGRLQRVLEMVRRDEYNDDEDDY